MTLQPILMHIHTYERTQAHQIDISLLIYRVQRKTRWSEERVSVFDPPRDNRAAPASSRDQEKLLWSE